MSRQPQLKPLEEKEEETLREKPKTSQEENVKIIPTDVFNFESHTYQTKLLENINNGIGTIINCLKQAGFKVE